MIIPEKQVSAFISYGEKKCMYTLWVIVDQSKNNSRYNFRSAYVKNLSNDKERAIEKAVEYAAENGIEFVSTTNADALLNEIHRRTADEMEAARVEAERQAEEREQKAIEERNRIIEENVIIFEEQFQSECFTFGKYDGETFEKIMATDPQYIKYIIDNSPDAPYDFPTRLREICVNALHAYVAEHGYPKGRFDDSVYVGTSGERIDVAVTVVGKSVISGYYGDTTLYKFADKDDNLLVTFYSGTKMDLDIDDELTITGTVDKHQLYDNVKQTTLKRVKSKG